MNSKDLLSRLSALERVMNDFSFEELNIAEARALQTSFQNFKDILEHKLFGQNSAIRSQIPSDSNSIENFVEKENKANTENDGLLISRVSHEIRTPLSGILGFTDLLLESELTDPQKQQVSAVQSASHLLIDIVNELLEYTKLSCGTSHFVSMDFNLRSIVSDVTFLSQTLITERNVNLKTKIDVNVPEVLVGDPTKLNQILLNLLGNAIKFVQEGEIDLTVSLKRLKGTRAFLEFTITDTGIGIAEEDLDHIFEPFVQSSNSNTPKGGHGLGLSIVKRMVDVLGGDIAVSSRLGVGTTFIITLPYDISNKAQVKQKRTPPQKKAIGQENLKDKHILVFEDNLINQKLIEQRLTTWQCKVTVTDDVAFGLKLLENSHIDLVLMDLWMPKMTGFEAADNIRQNKDPNVSLIPIIALTADLSLKNKELCSLHGINDFVLKPYDREELLSKMLKNLNGMKSKKEPNPIAEKLLQRPAEAPPKVDLNPILEECMGDLSLLEELVRLYKQNALEFLGEVKIQLKQGDFERLKFAAHKIKSGLAMMKTFSLREIAVEIHSICEVGQNIDELRMLARAFANEYLTIEKSINQEMEELRNRSGK